MFIIQTAVSFAVLYFIPQSQETLADVFFVVFLGTLVASVVVFSVSSFTSGAVVLAAADASLSLSVSLLEVSFVVALGSLTIPLFAGIAAYEVGKSDAREPFWARFIAAFPLGVGMLFGGPLYFFLYRKLVRQNQHPARGLPARFFREPVKGNEIMPPDEP